VLRHRPEQRSQGEVKFLTGGSCQQWQEPASACLGSCLCRVSRSGVLPVVIPEPTVTVRMKETHYLELPYGCAAAVVVRVLILATSI
jgi:hypothetical protein